MSQYIGGDTGNKGTFVFTGRIFVGDGQTPFAWIKYPTNTYVNTGKLSAHLPWTNSLYAVQFGNITNGSFQDPNGVLPNDEYIGLTTCIYRQDATTAQLLVMQHDLFYTSSLDLVNSDAPPIPEGVGRFMLGTGGANFEELANMEFYSLLFYPFKLTDNEVASLSMYLFNKYKSSDL